MLAALFTRPVLPRRLVLLVVALGALILPRASLAQNPCPTDSVAADYDPLHPYAGGDQRIQECHQNLAATAGTFSCGLYCFRGDCYISTDLDHATGAARVFLKDDGSLIYGLLVLRDRFTAHTQGAPGATTLEVRLDLNTRVSRLLDTPVRGGGGTLARLETPGGAVEWNAGGLVDELNPAVELSHQLVSPRFVVHDGDAFDLRWTFTGSVVAAGVETRSQLTIVTIDGPPATLSSCRGYAQVAVPVRTMSWGGIKAQYR